jgi:hypothetical protein
MNEANIDVVLDPDVSKEGEASAKRSNLALAEDHLPTTRLPPIAPPPIRPPSIPPTAVGSIASSSRNTPTLPPQSAAPTLEATTRYRQDSVVQQKPSWFRALLTSTSPPPAYAVEHDPVRRAVAVGCVVAAFAFAVIALAFAFRSPPSIGTMQPAVAASVVIAHALLAIGSGALGFGLLRIAERLLAAPAGPHSQDLER